VFRSATETLLLDQNLLFFPNFYHFLKLRRSGTKYSSCMGICCENYITFEEGISCSYLK